MTNLLRLHHSQFHNPPAGEQCKVGENTPPSGQSGRGKNPTRLPFKGDQPKPTLPPGWEGGPRLQQRLRVWAGRVGNWNTPSSLLKLPYGCECTQTLLLLLLRRQRHPPVHALETIAQGGHGNSERHLEFYCNSSRSPQLFLGFKMLLDFCFFLL